MLTLVHSSFSLLYFNKQADLDYPVTVRDLSNANTVHRPSLVQILAIGTKGIDITQSHPVDQFVFSRATQTRRLALKLSPKMVPPHPLHHLTTLSFQWCRALPTTALTRDLDLPPPSFVSSSPSLASRSPSRMLEFKLIRDGSKVSLLIVSCSNR